MGLPWHDWGTASAAVAWPYVAQAKGSYDDWGYTIWRISGGTIRVVARGEAATPADARATAECRVAWLLERTGEGVAGAV